MNNKSKAIELVNSFKPFCDSLKRSKAAATLSIKFSMQEINKICGSANGEIEHLHFLLEEIGMMEFKDFK